MCGPVVLDGRVRTTERERGNRAVSRAIQIADSTVLLIASQTKLIGGRWHLAECRFTLVPLYPSHQIVPAIVTDRMLYRLFRNTGRPRGYRLRTIAETDAWHRGATCWSECQYVQGDVRPDGLTDHILHDCGQRCRAIQATIARNAVSLGTTETRLRTLAGRRHQTGRYLSDDGDTLRALYHDTDGAGVRRNGVADRGRTTGRTVVNPL